MVRHYDKTDLVVVSTAIEDTVYEVQKAKQLNIPIIKRSELLALIAESKKQLLLAELPEKVQRLLCCLQYLNMQVCNPAIISGAGLTSIIKEGKIGNAKVGKGRLVSDRSR
jgi:UDP-N-acetylmuramate--alanine ligase